jgi:hypothetical protein
MEKEASFIEINDNVVTLKIVIEGKITEQTFNSSDLQRLRVHETLLKDYYRSISPRGNKIDPFELGDF